MSFFYPACKQEAALLTLNTLLPNEDCPLIIASMLPKGNSVVIALPDL